MRFKKIKFILSVLTVGAVLWKFYGFNDEQENFSYYVAAGGFDSPTFVDYIRLNGSIGFPFGGMTDGRSPDTKIFGSMMGLYKPEPVPYQVDARWFSYQTEAFYEISLEIPEEKQQQIRNWYRMYPERGYSHSLQLGISGKGNLRLYWQANCQMLEGCPSEPRKLLEIYDRLPAKNLEIELTREHFGFIYSREEFLCHAFVEGTPSYDLPDDLLSGSENLDDYRRIMVLRQSINAQQPFNYRLVYRDGTSTSGVATQFEDKRNVFLVEWEDPYNPPYQLFIEDKEGKNNYQRDDRVHVPAYNRTLYPDWNITGFDYSDYFHLDQRFLLPSREYFEWPAWAEAMRWQDFRRNCKNGIYMRLSDTNGDLVRGGVYELIDNETGEIITEGRTDSQGFTEVRIKDYRENNWTFR